MTATPHPGPPGLVAQLSRFVAVGVLSALVDFGVYQGLLGLGTWVHLAKGASFVCGTLTAYLLNRRFTFAASGGRGRLAGFLLLYATTFALNVGVNALMLAVLPPVPLRVTAAWVVAQGAATVVNFVMLRTVVFRHRAAAGPGTPSPATPSPATSSPVTPSADAAPGSVTPAGSAPRVPGG